MIHDYIIIGGGISGLYANYILSKKYNGLLLEKESYFGGRAYEKLFHGTLIKMGAGVLQNNNTHLLKLLKKLKIKPNSFTTMVNSLLDKPFDIDNGIKEIKKVYSDNKDKLNNLTMKNFLIKYFGTKFANNFIDNCVYHDYLDSSVEYFIKYYDINDMTHKQHTVSYIRWIDLINKLVLPNCKNNYDVVKIKRIENNLFSINDRYKTKKIIMATTLKPLNLLNKLIDFKYNDYIGTVPFVRIYTWHKNGYDKSKIKGYNLVNNELQKILIINDKILMTAYSDDKDANYWKSIANKDKKIQIKKVTNKLKELNINIDTVDDVEMIYWNEGVHYYKPFKNMKFTQILKKISHPTNNIYVVGEIVSKKQGWVEGCIESVDRIL
jgi:hypothetical protein